MILTIKATKDTEGTVTRDCRSFESLDEAKVRYHSDLSANISKEGTAYVMCAILREDGTLIDREAWYAPEEDPEAEEEA